jgi:K+-sensing histidine kinase KdpD
MVWWLPAEALAAGSQLPAEALAAGWPLAVVLGLSLVAARGRERRRTASLEFALHELRRPLQALALSPPRMATDGPGIASERLASALAALGDLERAVDGAPAGLRLRPVALRPLVQAAIERCSGSAFEVGLTWSAGEAAVEADAARVGQALDNLLENALEHGRPPVRVSGAVSRSVIRVVVMNATDSEFDSNGNGAGGGANGNGSRPRGHGVRAAERAGKGSGPRGHGLRIVAAIASSHGGRFLFDRTDSSAMAMLELPLARSELRALRSGAGRRPGVGVGAPAA